MSSRPDVVESWGPGWWDRWTAWAGRRDGELQAHVTTSARHWVHDGVMHLEAARDVNGRWSSPFLCSRLLFPPSGGTLTARVRPAYVPGHLPAVWLVGGTWPSSDWPRGGELDVLEALTTPAGPIVHGNLQGFNPTAAGDARLWKDGVHVPATPGEWVTVAVELHPDRITWSVDGVAVHTWTAAQLPAGMAWPWRRPSQLLLSTAVGNPWTGRPPADGPASVITQVGELRWTWS